jgi:hypothetical protein
MAILWVEGFEEYGTATGTDRTVQLRRRYLLGVSSSPTYCLTGGRVSGYGLYGTSPGAYLLKNAFVTTADTLVVGTAICPVATNTSDNTFLRLYDGVQLGVNFTANVNTGEINVYCNATLLGSTSGLNLAGGAWYYIEVKVKCHDSAGTVEVRVGGATKLNLTGQNTKAGSHYYHDGVRLDLAGYFYHDDVYVCDKTGSVNNDFLGNCRVVGLIPSADTATHDWTPSTGSSHYAMVNETLENDDANYLEDGTSGHADLWGYAAGPALGAIKGVKISTVCRETDVQTVGLITLVNSGATTSPDSSQPIGSTTYVARTRIVELDPATGNAWTGASLNAAQFGVKVA